jgi:hypothetical protein
MEKPGVGVLLDLGEITSVGLVRLETELSGWRAQVRVADEAGDTEVDFTRITAFAAQTSSELAMPPGTSARYVLIWITRLVEHNSTGVYPHRAEVGEVSVFSA